MAPFLCLMFAIAQRKHKTKSPLAGVGFLHESWSGQRESNPQHQLGRLR